MKVLTVTLNPSLDKTYHLDKFNRGGTNRINSTSTIAGGKGVNVSRALAGLGVDVDTFVATGGNLGDTFRAHIESELNPIYYNIQSETRLCHKIKCGNTITELNEPSPYLEFGEVAEIFDRLSAIIPKYEVVAFCGSVPQGVDTRFVTNLIRLAPDKFYFDSSGASLKAGIECNPHFVKPNGDELLELGLGTVEEAVLALSNQGISRVTATMGHMGAAYVRKGEVFRAYYSGEPIEVASTVGCGDSFVASCILNHHNKDMHEVVSFAVACATANAISGKGGKVDIISANDILPKITVRRATPQV